MRRHIRVQGSSIGGSKKTMGGYWSKSENENEENMRIEMGMPQIILNYAFLLEENSYFEDALKVEDKARAGESFFEYDVSMYAKLEEDYGLAKRALKVYGKATKKVPEGQVSHVILPLFPLFSAHKQLFVLNFENPFVEEKEELNKAGFPEDKMASLERQLMAPMSATVTPKDGGRQLGKREEDGKKAEEGGENGAAKALGAL
uniref:Pre-mRNA-splicing factor Syf1/CRNKL1-like C-terminal HAT-repeats domain-containing protein n=1 Tax=Brassica oleracea var. oleracea TaxID=109376 RepID=A0A0D3BUB5_BRAOL